MTKMDPVRAIAIAAALAIQTVAAAPAMAQQLPIDTIDQTELVGAVNEQTVIPALSVVAANHLFGADGQGKTTIVATASNGLKFEINFRACTDEEGASDEQSASKDPDPAAHRHCRGILLLTSWDPLPAGHEEKLDGAIEAFLIENPAANAGTLRDGAPYLARYVIADFGAPQGNLASEFGNFIRIATDFQNSVAPIYAGHE